VPLYGSLRCPARCGPRLPAASSHRSAHVCAPGSREFTRNDCAVVSVRPCARSGLVWSVSAQYVMWSHVWEQKTASSSPFSQIPTPESDSPGVRHLESMPNSFCPKADLGVCCALCLISLCFVEEMGFASSVRTTLGHVNLNSPYPSCWKICVERRKTATCVLNSVFCSTNEAAPSIAKRTGLRCSGRILSFDTYFPATWAWIVTNFHVPRSSGCCKSTSTFLRNA
jgi:hypothetical protein